jgi:hypothetical protein
MPDPKSVPASATPIEKVLDMARWAPSGDNTQVWRFELIDATSAWVHGHDTRDHVVYDFEGRPSQIALGALLETIRIAASMQQLRVEIVQELPTPDTNNSSVSRFRIVLIKGESLQTDMLADYITSRSVQRRALTTTPLTELEKSTLEAAAGEHYQIKWQEGAPLLRRVAGLLFRSAQIRLTMPEAYEVHRSIIQWNSRYSQDKVPDQAIGMDPVGLKMMRWALQSWQRVKFLNRYLAGTWLPRIQLDWVPAMACGAHFVICADKPAQTIADYIQIGRALQRFWLTATHLGIQLQPEMTPLIFASYVHNDQRFSKTPEIWNQAVHLEQEARTLLGADTLKHAGFMGRVGYGNSAQARSLRLPLSRLLIRKE